MKAFRIAMAVLLSCFAVAAAAESDVQMAFDKMKSLAGTWEGKRADGKTISTKYQLAAGGTSLMDESSEDHMVTMFFLTGGHLVLARYCSTGTQPHMQASVSPDGKTIAFEFVDGANIPTMDSGHMHRAVLRLTDPDHYTEEWTRCSQASRPWSGSKCAANSNRTALAGTRTHSCLLHPLCYLSTGEPEETHCCDSR